MDEILLQCIYFCSMNEDLLVTCNHKFNYGIKMCTYTRIFSVIDGYTFVLWIAGWDLCNDV